MRPLINWIKSLPSSQRPTSAAYPSVNDPFSLPAVATAQLELHKQGIRTAYTSLPKGINEVTATKDLNKAEATAYHGPPRPRLAATPRSSSSAPRTSGPSPRS